MEVKTVTLAAADLFNLLSKAHNEQVEKQGLSRDEAALVSYMALRVMLDYFEPHVNTVIAAESWPTVNLIMDAMRSQLIPHGEEAPPKACA